MTERDLVVIGGGPGGLVVTSVAAQLGLRVSLIEREPRLGGDCLHYGCVPSKTLLRSAKVASLMRRGEEFGLPGQEPVVDLAAVMGRVRQVVERIQAHDDPERFRGYGAEVRFGQARLLDPHTVRVDDQDLRARRLVLATGSRPAVPEVAGLTEVGFVTNEQVFGLTRLPHRLAVLGAGPVGVELGQAFARLGSRVSLLDGAPEILGREDPELAGRLRQILRDEGLAVRLGVRVEQVQQLTGGKRLRLSDGTCLDVDEILVATGRRPSVEGLGLEAAEVRYGPGGIEVDARMRTSRRHIYACGDCAGPYPYTHMAEYQAGIVISNAVFRWPKRADYSVVPRVVYSDPELAQVGLTEAEARARGLEPQVLRYDFSELDRALTDGETGLIKLITQRRRILGASILGPRGGELIHEIALAMQAGLGVDKLSATIHAYPTLAQAHRRAANRYYAPRLFSPTIRRLVGWLNRLP